MIDLTIGDKAPVMFANCNHKPTCKCDRPISVSYRTYKLRFLPVAVTTRRVSYQ